LLIQIKAFRRSIRKAWLKWRDAVQPDQDLADQELLTLAEETERLAATMADTKFAVQLNEIAAEVRSMAAWIRETGDRESSSRIFRPVA
jgi:hypothetical protein